MPGIPALGKHRGRKLIINFYVPLTRFIISGALCYVLRCEFQSSSNYNFDLHVEQNSKVNV